MKNLLLWIGEIFFLAAVTMLIVRHNSYPLIIKRASDILILFSFIIVISALFYSKDWKQIFNKIKKHLIGFSLIFIGLTISSLIGYFLNGRNLGSEGILTFLRFVEVAAIFFLVSVFQFNDKNFFKRAAICQLSTLAYLPFLFARHINPHDIMGRFQFFENWPSNVGYYLIVSIVFTISWFLFYLKPFKWKFIIPYFASVGFISILLGTQSRASWIAVAISILIIFIIWLCKTKAHLLNVFFGAALVFSLVPLSFLVLPRPMDTIVFLRFFPQIKASRDFEERPSELVGAIKKQDLASQVSNFGGRPELWLIYIKKILNQPLGFGLDYQPINIGRGDQGPHNTPLEALVLGGPLALIGIGYLFFMSFKNILKHVYNSGPQNYQWPLYIFVSLFGLFFVSFFDNMVTFRLMWLMLALATWLI